MLLKGRKAVVTGAAGRIGSAIAKRFVQEGCSITLMDRNGSELQAFCDHLRKQYNAKVQAVQVDVTDEREVQRVFSSLEHLDILVNNAGCTQLAAIEEQSLEQWDHILKLNLSSIFLCSKYSLPLLRESSAPAIVNMSSVNALRMNPSLSAYSAAKSGIIAFTQQLALEGAAMRIRANCISPGATMTVSEQEERANDPSYPIEADCYPLGRLAYPEDVANAALFLSSELSSFVNGINLVVDGGMSLQAVSALVRLDLRQRWKSGHYILETEG